jgi:hypothetical protein
MRSIMGHLKPVRGSIRCEGTYIAARPSHGTARHFCSAAASKSWSRWGSDMNRSRALIDVEFTIERGANLLPA